MIIEKRDRVVFSVREKKSLRDLLKGPRITKEKALPTLPIMKKTAYNKLVRRIGDQIPF